MLGPDDRSLADDVSLILELLAQLQEGDFHGAADSVAELRGSRHLPMIVMLLCRDLPPTNMPRLNRAQRRFLAVLGESSALKLSGAEPPLTSKQVVVLRCVKEGLTNIDAADRLGVSANTVKWHLKTLFRALGVSNRRALVHQAELRGLL